jgi:hypothetical protein
MQVIEVLCQEYEVEFDWLQEDILRLYHEKKIRNEDLDEKALKKVLEKALQKI